MLQNARREQLLNRIKQKGTVTIKELTEYVGSSLSTLQRDLRCFEEDGIISRNYGGVVYLDDTQKMPSAKPFDYEERSIENLEEKRQIGKAVQQLIQQDDVIFLTHGTTTSQIAHYIAPNKYVTIFTDGMDIMLELADKSSVRVLSQGGQVNYFTMQIELSPYVPTSVPKANISKLIMGVGGISEQKGITFYDYESFRFLQGLLPHIDEVIVVADHTKFGKVELANFIELNKIHKVVTDDKVDLQYVRHLEDIGIECIIAKAE